MQVIEQKDKESECMELFYSGIKSNYTLGHYKRHFYKFLEMAGFKSPVELLELGKEDPQKLTNKIITIVNNLKMNGSSHSKCRNYVVPVQMFCTMNDISINTKKIHKAFPAETLPQQRAIKREEIQTLINNARLEIKVAILTMVSGGLRVGALADLEMSDIEQIGDSGIAKVVVYRGAIEQYMTFITPETYSYIKEWLQLRTRRGEIIKPTTKIFPTPWGVRVSMHRLYNRINIRGESSSPEKRAGRYAFSANHSFRRFFRTNCELSGMKEIHTEMVMGHKKGDLRHRYTIYEDKEKELLADYEKCVPALTMMTDLTPNKQIAEQAKQTNTVFTVLVQALKALNNPEVNQLMTSSNLDKLVAEQFGDKQ